MAAILTAAMAAALAACGSTDADTSDADSANVAEESAEDTTGDESEEESAEITFESLTAVDNDYCSIVITGINEGGLLTDLSLSAEFENKTSDVTYMFSVESAYINGVDADPYFADTVAAGKNAIETISFDTDELADAGIESVTDIQLTFIVYNNDDWTEDYAAEETVHVYPYGEEAAENFVRETLDTDTVLADDDNVSVVVTGYEVDDIWGYCINVYLVNKSDTEVMYSVDEASVNGYMADPYWAKTVKAGKSAFSTIYFDESTLEEIGITDMETEIETIEFELTAYDDEDWSEDPMLEEVITLTP